MLSSQWLTTIVLLDHLQYWYIGIVSQCVLPHLDNGLTDSLTIWIFHMFVYGFGNYAVFLEINCTSYLFSISALD